MHLLIHTRSLFHQIKDFLLQMTAEQYNKKLSLLNSSSVGQHVRHIIEFFEELEKGYTTGLVNYDNRQRNVLLETDKNTAVECLEQIILSMDKKDKNLQLIAGYGMNDHSSFTVTTNYYREWMYNIEHTVHHMALIKTGVQALKGIQLPAGFGVAISTQRAQKACAQ